MDVAGHLQILIFVFKTIGRWEEKRYLTSIIVLVPKEMTQMIDSEKFIMSNNQSESILKAIDSLIQVDIALRSGEIYDNLGGIDADDLVICVIKLIESFYGTNKMFDEMLENSGTRDAALRKKQKMRLTFKSDIIN